MGHSDLGAFLLSIGRLRAEHQTVVAIARLLNIGLGAQRTPATRTSVPPVATAQVDLPSEPAAVPPQATTSIAGPEAAAAGAPVQTGEPQVLTAVKKSGPVLADPEIVPVLQAGPRWTASELPFEPLIRPVTARTVATGALSRRQRGGPIDLAALIETYARHLPITELPRLPSWSIAGWTHLFIDHGEGMTPFARDARDFTERVRAVAGRGRTEVKRFWRTPLRVGNSPTRVRPAPLPARGTAVLALTDLGIAPDAPDGLEDDWLRFANDLDKAGCSLVVFVPYPASRWPARLASAMSLIAWDRSTSVAAVLAVTRRRKAKT